MNKIDPDVFTFYKELTKNNNRNWFEHQKERFKKLELGIKKFAENIKLGLDTADDIEKVKLFRIYRDVRFSKDKTPYKTHFGIAFHRKKPELRGGYYIHISPNNSFIASGFWDPSPSDLLRIRKELEIDAQELIDIIDVSKFKKKWGHLVGEELKTAPRGFDKSHPHINLIKKKQFLFIKKFNDKDVISSDFQKKVIFAFKDIRPFFDYMTNVLTTDLNGVSLL